MAAVALAISGGGALSKIETTPLLTVEETMDAMGRAQRSGTARRERDRHAATTAVGPSTVISH